MKKREKRFSGLAAAIEMTAIVWLAYVWSSVASGGMERPLAYVLTVVGVVALGGALILRWNGLTRDKRAQSVWRSAEAVVNQDVIIRLVDEKIPIRAVQVVESIGNGYGCKLPEFTRRLLEQSGDLSDDQLDTILHCVARFPSS